MRIKIGIAIGLLLAVGTLAMAGCGESSNNEGIASVATPGATPTSGTAAGSEQEQMLKFAQCIRDNGVPNYPDPKFEAGGGVNLTLPEGADIAKLEAAQSKCKQFLPNGGEARKMDPKVLESLRKYAQCMRDNGVPNFPDPTDQGMQVDGSKVNPNDPKVQAAQKLCATYQPAPPSGAPGVSTQNGSNG